jgi:hypothetical protein
MKMGKFVNFFKKIGGGIKKAFNWVKDKIAPVVSKVWKYVGPVAKIATNFIPGVGPAISKGISIAEKVIPVVGGGLNKLINHSTNGETPQDTSKNKQITPQQQQLFDKNKQSIADMMNRLKQKSQAS